jgi:hypothetical protein
MQSMQLVEYQQKQRAIFEELERKAKEGAFGSFIPMTADFADDNRFSLAAIKFLPEDLSVVIEKTLVEPLREADERQFFFATKSLHMTVQNVRKISDTPTFGPEDIEAARAAFRTVVSKYSAFEFTLEGLLVLPASIAIRAIAEPKYAEFSTAIRNELRVSGVADDKTYINDDIVFGNITLCRFTHPPTKSFHKVVDELRNCRPGKLRIDSFALMSTNAICDLTKTVEHEKYKLLSN